jgi:hypothetical protein
MTPLTEHSTKTSEATLTKHKTPTKKINLLLMLMVQIFLY